MATRAEVNNEATKDVAAGATPSSSSLVQRKCACGGSAGMTGDCEECNDKRLSVQRSAIGSGPSLSSFKNSGLANAAQQLREREGVQTKLNVSEPGDKYELEADRVADAVMRNSDDAANVAGQRDDEDLVQTKLVDGITPLLQRQANEEEEEEEEDVQRKELASESLLTLEQSEEDKAEALTGQLSRAKMSGSSLPAALRQNMEQAFGVDFGQVKIHSDGAANSLSHSLHASAFTTGTHIFFRHGALDYGSTTGRRLLAHELTHVVQQNPLSRVKPISKAGGFRPPTSSPQESVAAPDVPVQRDVVPEVAGEELIQRADGDPVPDEDSREQIGYLYLFDRKGEVLFSFVVFHGVASPIEVGIHRASISGSDFTDLKIKSKGHEFPITDISITNQDPEDKQTPLQKFKQARKKARQVLLGITSEKRIRGGEVGTTEADKKGTPKPSGTSTKKTKGTETDGVEGGDKEKGVEGGTGTGTVTPGVEGGETEPGEGAGEQTGEGPTGEGEQEGEGGEQEPGQPPPTATPPADEFGDVPTDEVPAEETPTDTPKEETPASPEEGQVEEGKAKEKTGDIQVDEGSEGGKKGGTGPGSKYGHFGLIDPPQWVVDALVAAFEALGNSDEFLAISQLLTHLEEFKNHGNEMRLWFEDPDLFIRVVLGLETSGAITALESWVKSPLKKRRRKLRSAGKGLRGILTKVMRVLEAIRSILDPVITTRQGFVAAFGASSEILEEIPAFEELMSEVAKPGSVEHQALVERLATDFTSGIQRKLEEARGAFTVKLVKLGENDLITYEELANAIVSAARKALPPQAKAFATVAEKAGLLELTADKLVAPLIPKEALGAINGLLGGMFDQLEPVLTGAEAVLDEVINESQTVLKEQLVPLVKDIFMPQRTSAFSRFAPSSDLGLLNMMRQSRGDVLQGPLRREMETTMGFDFGSIRIHHDFAAQRASQMFQANAFTVGSDIFFGPGKFNPDTDGGRHLLAHELTHSIQQGNGVETGVVQRSAKGLSEEIAKKYAEFLKEAKKFKASPQRKAEAAEMRTVVEGLIGQPISKVLKKLPIAYDVVRKKGGKIVIRRKTTWVFLVPPLRVVNKKLAYGFLYYDKNKAARRDLRASKGCKKNEQAHHIIPLELREHDLCNLAIANKFEFNGFKNGICLGKKVHSGSHPIYTASIRKQLNDLTKQYMVAGELEWSEDLSRDFDDLLSRNHRNLKARTTKLR